MKVFKFGGASVGSEERIRNVSRILRHYQGDKLLVGVAMVPRGEVGLIFAQMGLASGAIGADIFGALMLMVLVTTFVTPPLLGRLARERRPADIEGQPGDGGIDDLVAGSSLAEGKIRSLRQDDVRLD